MNLFGFNQNFGETSEYLYFFIATVLVVWFLLLFFSLKVYGFKKTIRFFLPIFFISLFLETIALSKGNYYYPGYLFYISIFGGSLPIIIPLSWCVNLVLFSNVSDIIVSKFFVKQKFIHLLFISILAGLLVVLLDIFYDPIAHHNKWWVWNKSLPFVKFFGVPVSNFMGLFISLSGMCLLTLLIDRSEFSENRKLAISLSIIPIVFIPIVIYFEYLL